MTGLYPTGTTCANVGSSTASYHSSDDAWGNVTTRFFSGTTATLSYDALDHFTEWNAGSNNHEWYIYDGNGERLVRRSTMGNGTTLTTYPFGDEHRYNSTGAALDSTYYLTLAGRLIGTVTGSGTLTTQYLLEDALGSPLAAFSNADGTTNVLGSALYGPYGNQRVAAGSLGTAKGFTGQYNDSLVYGLLRPNFMDQDISGKDCISQMWELSAQIRT